MSLTFQFSQHFEDHSNCRIEAMTDGGLVCVLQRLLVL